MSPASVDVAGCDQADRPDQVSREHAPGQLQGQLLATGAGGSERRPVAVRDADEHDPPTGTNGRDRVRERIVATGLERHVDRSVTLVVRRVDEAAGPSGTTYPSVAPVEQAAATRCANRSVATTTEAPDRRRSWTSRSPIGPQP